MSDIDDKIRVKQMEVNLESDPAQKQELQKQLRKLQLRKEIEVIRAKSDQLD
jgi:hypothetical protein